MGGSVVGPLASVFSKTKPDFMKWLLKVSAIAVLSEMTRSFTLSVTGMVVGLFLVFVFGIGATLCKLICSNQIWHGVRLV